MSEQTRTGASQPNLALTVFPGRGRHVPAPSGGASGLSFGCLLPPSLLSSVVFRAGFSDVVLEQEVRGGHFGHPRG